MDLPSRPFHPATLPERIAHKRRQLCLYAGRDYSVPELASAIGVTKATWYTWERGEAEPHPLYRPPLCALLMTTEVYLWHGAGVTPGGRELHPLPTIARRPVKKTQQKRA